MRGAEGRDQGEEEGDMEEEDKEGSETKVIE